ncbi:MAG: Na+/H+ antiporter NhaA [Acidimicrobiia bacterium]|nr:Na+/H+ antiporter NhaA [Acidimicrobiia bacterium]
MAEGERIYQTWVDSDRFVPSRFVRPARRFMSVEAAGGIVLLIAAVLAVVWANMPFGETYERFWSNHFVLEIGDLHVLDESLRELVNDALMTVFFFVVGLEIKRELVVGELRDRKKAALPALAALGGMIVPALVYVALTAGEGGQAAQGWGIPMATDIAFSIGVISLLGARISPGAKLFLLALAIADDIGAIAVIAIFYTDDLSLMWLFLSLAGLTIVYAANRAGVRSILFYVVAGTAVWYFVLESGVHATLAGVALGLMTPVVAMYSDDEYHRHSTWLVSKYEMDAASPESRERVDADALQLASIARESVSPLDRLEHALHPWSSFLIVPVFALANAGIRFADIDVGAAVTSGVALGVAFGLVFGKLFGITVFTWVAVKLGWGKLPRRTGWAHVFGLAALAGIGFTVSLFITDLAFTDALLTDQAKIGIFIGSGVAGITGYLVLRSRPTPQEEFDAAREAEAQAAVG